MNKKKGAVSSAVASDDDTLDIWCPAQLGEGTSVTPALRQR
jgi:hypothetical protein